MKTTLVVEVYFIYQTETVYVDRDLGVVDGAEELYGAVLYLEFFFGCDLILEIY